MALLDDLEATVTAAPKQVISADMKVEVLNLIVLARELIVALDAYHGRVVGLPDAALIPSDDWDYADSLSVIIMDKLA